MRQQAIELERDGQTIRGMAYLPDRPGRAPTMVMLHGFTGQRMESGFLFVRLSRLLAGQGVAAITFDFLGSGESDGAFDEMLVTGEVADALRVTQWAAGQPYVDRSRMGLLGFSLGGLVAAATVGRTEVYRALVLMAPTTVANLCRHAVGPDGNEKQKPVVLGPNVLHSRFFDDARTLDPVSDVAKHARPTLLVQGSADTAVTPEVSGEFVAAMRHADVPCEVVMINEADHGFSMPPWRKLLYDAVLDFARRTLH